MFLRGLLSLVLIFGFIGCGEIKYSDDETNRELENNVENASSLKTGEQLYTASCQGCHGKQGEKEALGNSQLIGGQSSSATKYQLEEYKAGRLNQYNMGEIMKGQAQQLTSSEIVLVSKYIETLSVSSNPIVPNITPTTSIVEKDIFTKCKGCHGAKGEISALGKSKIIRNMNKLEIYNALTGYQNGTYGGEMKALMKGQVNGMSKTELKDLARYIDAL